jgi:hypothetical protein
MASQVGSLLRAGLALKVDQVKHAAQSYVRDQTAHQKSIAGAYAVATGLYAAAGIFLIAACLVGAAALFRWIEIEYGEFPAYGAAGALLVVLTAICAAIAASALKPHPPNFPSLTSRLRVAIKASPLGAANSAVARPDARTPVRPSTGRTSPIEAARTTAADVLRQSPNPSMRSRTGGSSHGAQVGLVLTATLLGWALARRRQQAGRAQASRMQANRTNI